MESYVSVEKCQVVSNIYSHHATIVYKSIAQLKDLLLCSPMKSIEPLIFSIKRYALHDGPNIRTTVFFKGCPLNCFWCHNPEGISPNSEVVFIADKCIGCRECLAGCPEQALSIDTSGIVRDQNRCSHCFECVEICPALAQEGVGYRSSAAQILAEIKKDLPFFDQSGGGVTFSGGEPLLQKDALLVLLQRCGELGIHRAVDTTGFAPTPHLLEVAEHADMFLYDLKHMDPILHREYTGVPNELILSNLERLARLPLEIRVRIPLLQGINDNSENVEATAKFITSLGRIRRVDLLAYHHFASSKYTKLGSSYHGTESNVPDALTLSRVKKTLEQHGLDVHLGG